MDCFTGRRLTTVRFFPGGSDDVSVEEKRLVDEVDLGDEGVATDGVSVVVDAGGCVVLAVNGLGATVDTRRMYALLVWNCSLSSEADVS